MSTPLARRKAPNRTKPAARRPSPPAAAPEQYRELAAMGVIAVGAFLGVQLFLGVGVGPLGGWLESAARLGVGRLVWALPVLLAAAGILLLIDHPIIEAPPARMGVAVGVLTACLASAAGSFGLGGATREQWFTAHTMKGLGGFVGETLYFVTAHLMGGIGTRIRSPLVAGFSPRSDSRIALSTTWTIFFSQGCTAIVRASWTVTLATCPIGTMLP